MTVMLTQGDAFHIPLADASVHVCITSPPFWGLRRYAIPDNGTVPLGLEPLHDCLGWATGNRCGGGECYVCRMVAIFREVRRVLRDDGTVWLNLGDSFASGAKGSGGPTPKQTSNRGSFYEPTCYDLKRMGLKPKDMCGIPWRVALALQADGWWLRSDIIWAKPNPMPESVTDRCTKSHEYVFMLSKSQRYYYDAEAVKEISHTPPGETWEERKAAGATGSWRGLTLDNAQRQTFTNLGNGATRNLRDVWTIPTASYKGAHFATFPPALVLPCIRAGTSERGVCGTCGAPYERVVERDGETNREKADRLGFSAKNPVGQGINCAGGHGDGSNRVTTTLGWRPTCSCPEAEPVPAVVLDPFCGTGTTCLVALQEGRRGVGIDLSAQYLTMAQKRLDGVQVRLHAIS